MDVSADGRFVTFVSGASNFVPDDTDGENSVFIHQVIGKKIKRLATTGDTIEETSGPSMSGNDNYVAFESKARNLVPGDIHERDVFLHDAANYSGAGSPPPGTNIWIGYARAQPNIRPRVSGNGRFVAFGSFLKHDSGGDHFRVVVYDRVAETFRNYDLPGDKISINADGRFVVTGASILDRATGAVEEVVPGSTAPVINSTISGDGRFVAFESPAAQLVPNDSNEKVDVFVRDRRTRKTERVSVSTAGAQANGHSSHPTLTTDGRLVAFDSDATNLVPNDVNARTDVLVRDRGLLPDGKNDLAIDFGARGFWLRLSDAIWSKIDNGSPGAITVGEFDGNFRDELVAGFSGRGLLARYNNAAPWRTLHGSVPTVLVAGEFNGNTFGDIFGYFPQLRGLNWWRMDDGAATIEGIYPDCCFLKDSAVGDLDGNGQDDIVSAYKDGLLGISLNNMTGGGIFDVKAARIETGDFDGNGKDDLLVESDNALYEFANIDFSKFPREQPQPVKILDRGTQGLATGDLDGDGEDDVLADFGRDGLWAFYNNVAPWVKLDNRSPTIILATDLDGNGKEDIVAGFGSEGVFVRRNNAGAFQLLRAWPAQAIAAGGFD